MSSHSPTGVDADALELFLSLARDAARDGNPLAEHSAFADREAQGGLHRLKDAGLLTTIHSGGHLIVHVTVAGRALAREHGVNVPS